jgi:cyclopropane fatty-acyl-phospholipid synthase-like methyltransferase
MKSIEILRVPVVPNFIERLLLRYQPNLSPFLDLWGPGAFQWVQLASSMGVFRALESGPRAPNTIAREIGADTRGMRILLLFLESFGYVKKTGDSYSLTPTARTFLPGSPFNMADTFELYAGLYGFIRESQEEVLRKGKPSTSAFDWFDQHPPMWKLFHSFEASIAKSLERDLASKLTLPPGTKRVLDVGGGHGLYSIMLCRLHPELSATIFDSPEPLEDAKRNIEAENLSGRISVQAGDFFHDNLGSGFDAALLFNVIHLFPPEANATLLSKVASALRPGGTVVIFDQFLGGEFGKVVKSAHAYYNLLFLITTGGQSYSFAEMTELLARAGLPVTSKKPVRSAASHFVFATRRS